MVETKVSPEIWNQEVEKFKNVCHELGRTIKGTELRNHFMGLKCRSWYPDNAPDYCRKYPAGHAANPRNKMLHAV